MAQVETLEIRAEEMEDKATTEISRREDGASSSHDTSRRGKKN